MSNNTAKSAALKRAEASTVFLVGWMTQQQTTFCHFKFSKSATVPVEEGSGTLCTLRVTFLKFKGSYKLHPELVVLYQDYHPF